MVRKSSDNTRLFIIIGILAFAIIVGTIVRSSYRERFTNPSKELIYFYMESCGYCKDFTPIWDQMDNNNKDTFTFNKYDLNKDEGKKLGDKYNITAAPTIMILPDEKIYDGERNERDIIAWAKSL